MASALALKRLVSMNVLPKSLLLRSVRPVAVAPATSRLLSTGAVRESDYEDENDYDEGGLDVNRHFTRLPVSTDAFDSQLLSWLDPFASAYRGLGSGGFRRGWDARETEEGLRLRFDMPGLGKEDVKVSVEESTLVIKGEAAGEEAGGSEEESGRRYSSRIELSEKMYKMEETKAEMKNGVLKITVPKVKEDERADAFHVKID
ncbi:23.6 kDa heat shock protein, mitochondrial-like [Punica granatum]|uniref:SHSP domain-containing protein n=2 Tax=Punica granatum TaxID=22663 RepID=A0A218X519_PUNGR|nr:23.6 kDa heat shock protein, mitochondrial-like [Punica granatum]OWM79452.1 hypothetical protein CDL15_Pgr022864 [Punica granatum]PKI65745.1 hypothetical protein CRG98_013817 [Punica granatum]